MTMYDAIVVGAGISGLSAAYTLHQHGANVLLIEPHASVGGSIRSERTAEGFVLEHGPNTVVSKDPTLWAHFAELGIAEKRLVADRQGGRRYVLLDGKLELIPTSPPAFLTSKLLSTAGKLRLLAEPLIPRTHMPDESIVSFCTRRLGSEPAERLIDPFVSGVYAGDPAATSMRAAFPTLWEAEQGYGSIVRGMLAKGMSAGRKRSRSNGAAPKPARPRSEMFTFPDGLVEWPWAIARALGEDRVWLHTKATALHSENDGWSLTVVRDGKEQVIQAAQVILASPADVTATLVEHLDQAAAQVLRAIPYAPLAVVHLGYRREDVAHPLDGFGMLCPGRERRKILGTLWNSSLFAGRAPQGAVLLTTFVGGARNPDILQQTDDQIISTVQREQQVLVGARGKPLLMNVTRWSRSIPQYVAGHTRRISALERLEGNWRGLYLVGNYRDGVSVERCWLGARAIMDRLARAGNDRQCAPVLVP